MKLDAALVRPAASRPRRRRAGGRGRVPRLAVGVVAGRGVDEDAPPVLGRLREVPALADLAVRHVLRQVVVDALLGDLDPAGVLAGAVERLARRVVHLHAVDEHPVVVEARHHGVAWSRSRSRPRPSSRGTAVLSKNPKSTFWASGALMRKVTRRSSWMRGYSAPRMFVDAGLPSAGFGSWAGSGAGEQGQQAGEPQAVHREVSGEGGIATPSGRRIITPGPRFGRDQRGQIDVAPQSRPGPSRDPGIRTTLTRSLEAFDRHRQDDRGGAVAPLHQLDAGDRLLLPGHDGQVADLLAAELERELRARARPSRRT